MHCDMYCWTLVSSFNRWSTTSQYSRTKWCKHARDEQRRSHFLSVRTRYVPVLTWKNKNAESSLKDEGTLIVNGEPTAFTDVIAYAYVLHLVHIQKPKKLIFVFVFTQKEQQPQLPLCKHIKNTRTLSDTVRRLSVRIQRNVCNLAWCTYALPCT